MSQIAALVMGKLDRSFCSLLLLNWSHTVRVFHLVCARACSPAFAIDVKSVTFLVPWRALAWVW